MLIGAVIVVLVAAVAVLSVALANKNKTAEPPTPSASASHSVSTTTAPNGTPITAPPAPPSPPTTSDVGVPCSQNPACNETATTNNQPSDGGMTPEQMFASDVLSQIPAFSVQLGTTNLTVTEYLGQYADNVCNGFSVENYYYGYTTGAEGIPGGRLPAPLPAFPALLDQHDAQLLISLAIEDVCPLYLSDIPYGDPGAP